MVELRGLAFAEFASQSLLGRTLCERGFATEISSELEEKDFGEGAVAYFDCGYVKFSRGDQSLSLYQSRFSDSWRFSELLGNLMDREVMNDSKVVTEIVDSIEKYLDEIRWNRSVLSNLED